MDFDDEKTSEELRQQLRELLGLYYNAASWIIYWFVHTQCHPDSEIPGFTLHWHEMQNLKIDREELLSQLMAGATDNPWVAATEHYDYPTFEGTVQSTKPGIAVNATSVERLHFKSDPKYLPYCTFMNVLRGTCTGLGWNYRDFLFKFLNHPCEEPMRFARILINGECDPGVLAQELTQWHTRMEERLSCLPQRSNGKGDAVSHPSCQGHLYHKKVIAFLQENLHSFDQSDPRIANLAITSHEMASVLHVSFRTMRRWNKCGEVPGGYYWPRPEKIDGNRTLFYLPKYLQAMQQLLPRFRPQPGWQEDDGAASFVLAN